MEFLIEVTKPSEDYKLLDSGDGEKLERYGKVVISRPDPQALWNKSLPKEEWENAHAIFARETKGKEGEKKTTADWKIKGGTPEKWEINFADLKFWIKPTPFKHTGLFPEQSKNWKWVSEIITAQKSVTPDLKLTILNLFGYTGGATLAASEAGAEVVHLDASRAAVTWAKENADLSGLSEKSIRWIVDDARAFLKREIKRGNTYDGIIMDPPTFGRGPNGEVWKIEEDFSDLLNLCKQVLSKEPLFFLINGYAAGYSALSYKNTLQELMKDWKGTVEAGELAISESSTQRLLPAGIFARWKAK